MADVAMPRLSDSMEEGTILKWLKSDGDEVKRGEELVEIETDKANMTYEADQTGVLKIVAQEGDTLPVGDTIAKIGAGGEDGERRASAGRGGAEQDEPRATRPASRSAAGEDARRGARARRTERVKQEGAGGDARSRRGNREADDGNGRVKASPIARRMAQELGVELAGL